MDVTMTERTWSTAEVADLIGLSRYDLSAYVAAPHKWGRLVRQGPIGSGKRRAWTAWDVVVLDMLARLSESTETAGPPLQSPWRDRLAAAIYETPWGEAAAISDGQFTITYRPRWELVPPP